MRTIWYMGAKTRLIDEIQDAVERAAPGGAVLDLMSGTAAVSQALAAGRRVVANDVQGYAATIARAYLEHPDDGRAFAADLDPEADLGPRYRENAAALLERLAPAVALEDAFLEACGLEPDAPDPDAGPVLGLPTAPTALARARREVPSDPRARAEAYRSWALRGTPQFLEGREAVASGAFARARDLFRRETVLARRADPARLPYCLASTYYPNVYLGVRQAIAVDSLRAAIDALEPRRRTHYLAALLHAASVATSATSHFCQPRGLVRDAEVQAVLARRALSIPSRLASYSREIARAVASTPREPGCRALQGDWRRAFARWDDVQADVVYADPPYTADHYSRFYHVLEVLTAYDYPALATTRDGLPTKGRYPAREGRHRSAFCVRRQVEGEVRALVHAAADRGAALVLSYGEENGLLLRAWRDQGATAAEALDRFVGLAREAYADVVLHRRPILHSGQGDSNHTVTELLLVGRRPRARARRKRSGEAACA